MDKETLKSYFETGKKPTQAQFGALIDAFYHKNETIPQSQIEGLDTTLEAKAETTDLGTKADLTAGNLTAENIEQWKEVLGVGDVSENMVTIDQDDEQGNVYTKEQVDDLLKNSGKNLGNSDLQLASGEVRTLDITGAKFQMKGLQDKQADASFNKKIVVNDNGEFAIKEGADIILQMPMEANITMNHIFPSGDIPPSPQWAEEIKDIMRNYKTYVFTPFTKADFVGNENLITNEGVFNHNKNAFVNSSKKMPSNEDWIIKITSHRHLNYAGISQEPNTMITVGFTMHGGWQTDLGGFGMFRGKRLNPYRSDGTGVGLIIKKGDLLISIGYSASQTDAMVVNGNFDFGDYMLALNNINAKIEYKILD